MEALARRGADRDEVVPSGSLGLIGVGASRHRRRGRRRATRTTAVRCRPCCPSSARRAPRRSRRTCCRAPTWSSEGGTRTPEEIVSGCWPRPAGPTRAARCGRAVDFIVRLSELAGPPEAGAAGARAPAAASTSSTRPRCARSRAALELFAAPRRSGRPRSTVDLSLGRGLRYYTGLVFEIYTTRRAAPLPACAAVGATTTWCGRWAGATASPACGF